MNCEYRVELEWPEGVEPPIPIGQCLLQGYSPPVCCTRFKQECAIYMNRKEYNTNTSVGHPIKDDDIVRHSKETWRNLG